MKKWFLILFVLIILPLVIGIECLFNEVNCEYPGNCGRYIDVNVDGLCDYSQNINAEVLEGVIKNVQVNSGRDYHFLEISFIIFLLYGLTFWMVKLNKMRCSTHKQIWNVILLISFLISGLIGIFLILRIEYGLNWGLDKLSLHVEAGIVMAIVSIIHIFEHMNYWKCYLKKFEKTNKEIKR